jgi:hypothetical protein
MGNSQGDRAREEARLAAKTDSTNNSPAAMQGVGASWSTMFDFDSIKKAMS